MDAVPRRSVCTSSFKYNQILFLVLPSGISGFNSRFITGLNYHLFKVMIFHVDMSDGNA